MAALSGAGLRAIAPDLRGRGESGRPPAVEDYEIVHSVADMLCVLNDLGVERAHVVGHDFGAVVAWVLAAIHPDRVDHLVVMSVGHPGTAHRRTIEQREKAWYTLLFQFEDVAERLLMRDDWRLFREWLRDDGDDDEEYIADLSREGSLTAGLRWYRANLAPHRQLEWVDWYNNERLHSACGRRPPAEYEALYLHQVQMRMEMEKEKQETQ